MWKEHLKEYMEEESNDHNKYMELAKEAERENCRHEAGVLRDIAHEEEIHHKLLAEMM